MLSEEQQIEKVTSYLIDKYDGFNGIPKEWVAEELLTSMYSYVYPYKN